ncbi:MAG: PAS domain S-box protein [Sphaerochaetaceae bacterium]|nr:PAS domain S-box protein [Sphaerochaetaceae bacterium]
MKKKELLDEALNKNSSYGVESFKGKTFLSAYYLTEKYPLSISIKLDYEKSLSEWEGKREKIFFLISLLISIVVFLVFVLIHKQIREKNKEIEFHKKQLESKTRLKHAYIVYQNTQDGIVITDSEANIIDVNNAFIKTTGYSLSEVKGLNPRILKSGVISSNIYNDMWNSIKNRGYWNGELVNKNKDGEFYNELLTINSVRDESGNIKNYIGVFTNISKQKEQEKKLKEQEHLLFQQSKMASMGEMLENIAHQWRQPLSVISMSASGVILKHQYKMLDDEYLNKSLEGIIQNTKHLSKTIDDFRNFFKPNKEKNIVYISDVIERTLNIVSSKFKNREIKVIKDIADISLNIFDNELVQVVMNILKNSQDALESLEPENRYIFIVAKKEEDNTISLSLKDSAGGIKDEVIDKIFEPYFTTKHQSQGTGIGLYMSEEIITKHMHGKLNVHNEEYSYEGKTFKGAVFTINIPL